MSEEKAQSQPQAKGAGGDVQGLMDDFRSARRSRHGVIWIVVIAILVVLAVTILRYVSYGKSYVTYFSSTDTQKQILERVERDLVPELRREATRLAEALRPEIEKMAKDKALAAKPELLDLLEKEQEIFKDNMTKILEEKLDAMLTQIIEEHKDTLEGEFPGIADQEKLEKLIKLLVDATAIAATNVFIEKEGRLQDHIEVLESMNQKIHRLRPRAESDKELLRQLGKVAVELLGRMRPAAHEAEAQPAGAR